MEFMTVALAFAYGVFLPCFLVWAGFRYQKLKSQAANEAWLEAIDNRFKDLRSEINVIKIKLGLDREQR